MNLTIKNIDEKNYEEITSLKVCKEQASYIETVDECLEESKEFSLWRPVGIYDGDKAIGFAMYGSFKNEGKSGRVWLDRFMISHENQGKGYGEAGARLLIDRLHKEYGYNKVYLSVYDNNKGAIALYNKLGFEFNGEFDINGEKVMVINLSDVECRNT